MAQIKCGENFKLEDEELILGINSPKRKLKGPYAVVFKSIKEKWAVVAYDWEDVPTIGIRWFHSSSGTPNSRGNATWLAIPKLIAMTVLKELVSDTQLKSHFTLFLTGEMTGEQLRQAVKEIKDAKKLAMGLSNM